MSAPLPAARLAEIEARAKAMNARVAARETLLAAAVLQAAQTFEAYAAMHAAKGSIQGDEKAAVNKHLAENMRAALALSDPPDPTADIPALLAAVRRLREALAHQQWQIIDRAIERYSAGEISELVALGLVAAGHMILDEVRRAALVEASNG